MECADELLSPPTDPVTMSPAPPVSPPTTEPKYYDAPLGKAPPPVINDTNVPPIKEDSSIGSSNRKTPDAVEIIAQLTYSEENEQRKYV